MRGKPVLERASAALCWRSCGFWSDLVCSCPRDGGALWGPLGLAEGAWQENVIDRPEAGRLAGRVGAATAPEP